MELKLTDGQFEELTKLYKAASGAVGRERAGHLVQESAEMMMMRRASNEAVHILRAIAARP